MKSGRSFSFSTVGMTPGATEEAYIVDGLERYTRYIFVLQAFNAKGPGPLSTEVSATTLEDGNKFIVWSYLGIVYMHELSLYGRTPSRQFLVDSCGQSQPDDDKGQYGFVTFFPSFCIYSYMRNGRVICFTFVFYFAKSLFKLCKKNETKNVKQLVQRVK